MARREGLPSALFPFMSVLACTIGALVVLLAVMALAAVDTTQSAQAEEEGRRSALAAERSRFEAERLEVEIALARWKEVDEALSVLGLEAGADLETSVDALRRAARAQAIEEALAEAAAEATRLAEERGEIEASLAVLESRRETLPILIDPTGLSARWQPFFIECEEEGVTALRASDDLRYFVPKNGIEMTGDLERYLRRVRSEPAALLVLLIRPEGLETARAMVALARKAGIRVARLPVPAGGDLDWRLVRRAEAAR